MNRLIKLLIVTVLLASSTLTAQSDYKKVQTFKQKVEYYTKALESVRSADELSSINDSIVALRNKFSADKKLLDGALYPENYNTTFDNLIADLQNAEEKLNLKTQVVTLQTQVSKLKRDLDELSKSYYENLQELTKIKGELADERSKNEAWTSRISSMRSNINKRDDIIKKLIDSLVLKPHYNLESMTLNEKKKVTYNIKQYNLLNNIKQLLQDNIQFINAAIFKPEDLHKIKNEQIDFKERWKLLGTTIANVMSVESSPQQNLYEINDLVNEWSASVDKKIWAEIKSLFNNRGIEVDTFYTGEQFVNSLTGYIDSKINSYDEGPLEFSADEYSVFVDSVWYAEINLNWMPFLLEKELLTEEQKIMVEEKITEWSQVGESDANTLRIVLIFVAIILLLVIIALFVKKRS
ncbi:MAG: hypothetical protein K9J16_01925 [Melioribacteraceae bacterium]|nr:hypothetical protein [Melioribacteraceae bacterium]MCF8353024.1 hypothetical protein [Melioribacteraceae bacterium]MCF8392915.1 hypothetical protein [Melioribacteraceae bacterium]MCF8417791.1 hypothetical protein [Melioribacteraceae bacterium]